jgi:CRP/FNR family cyclic AMP-dependent transcriptional regulator
MYLHPLLHNVSTAERKALIQRSELRSYRRNEQVLHADEWTDSIYCVTSGLLRVVVHGSGNSGDVTTDFIRRGDFFHGPSLSEDRYQAVPTLIAALPSSVYLVPVSAVRELCSKHPEVALGLLELAMQRMGMLRGQLRRISSLSADVLVSRVLFELTQLAPAGSGGYDKRITQAVIASYSGLSREVVNKTMRDMESRGLVWRDEHGIHVPADFASTDFGDLLPVEKGLATVDPRHHEPLMLSGLLIPSDKRAKSESNE